MSTNGGAGRKLMITIDVEAQPRRAECDHIDRLIWGRFDGAESGMAQLMAAAERRGLRLTTYFDYAEQYLYGDSMLDVAREIHRRGHDLQLHLHPEFLSNDFFRKHGTSRVHNLTSVQPEDAKLLAAFLDAAQREVTGQQPLAFRGGGYRFSDALLVALAAQGVRVDSSYNPSRPTQPVNVGFHKQFQWQNSTFELPVSNVFAFSSPEHYLDYNFNAQALWGKSPEDSSQRHRRYLDRFYASYGEDAVAVLVLHSWSLLERDAAGYYRYAGAQGLDRFEALLEGLEGYASVIDTSGALACMQGGALGPMRDLAAAERERKALSDSAPSPSSAVTPPVASVPATPFPALARTLPQVRSCPICGTRVEDFEDFNGPKRRCKGCGSVERQRAFAQLYAGELGKRHPLLGKRVLLIAPSSSEKRFLKELGVEQVITADIRPEVKPDILADVCDMSNVESESFDVIIASYVLTCVHSLERALSELTRVLKPGGLLLTSDPIARGRSTREHTDEKVITDWYGKEAYDKYRIGSFRSFGDEDAVQLVDRYLRCEALTSTDIANGSDVTWLVSQKDRASGNSGTSPVTASLGVLPSRQRLRTSGCTAQTTGERFATSSRELFRVIVPFGATGATTLVFDELVLQDGPPITLAEDSYLPGRPREIVVTDRQRKQIYASSDDGATFRRCYADIAFPQMVRQTLTLRNGHRIVKLDQSSVTYLFDERGRLLDLGQTGAWNWAGAQGIGQAPNGTVMFGEYAAFKKGIAMQPLSVWRLRNGAKRWEKALTLDAAYAPPEGQIRHFHLCTPNPAKPTQWLLSAGDKGRHNRLWTSDDDGDSWQEVELEGLLVPGVAPESTSGAARLTQINATDTGELIWGSDDKLGVGKAALMGLSLSDGQPTFRHLGWAGPNAVRNVVKLGPSLFMFLCETKQPAAEAAECVLLDVLSGRRLTLALPNLTGENSTTTDSLGSLSIQEGVGFFPALGTVLTNARNGILRLRWEDALPGGTAQRSSTSVRPPRLGSAPPSAAPPPTVARAVLSRPHFYCDPKRDHGLAGPTRVCFWDQTRKEFARLYELAPGEALNIPLQEVSETFDLKVKVQVRSDKGWVDKIDYRRVEIDAESLQGIRYRYFPRAGTRHLVVVFQAMNTTPGYNYLGTLKDVPASRLYIKDDYGEDQKTRSSYYLGARRSFDVSQGVRSLIREALVDLGLRPRDLVLGGSSKGAFAALFHGYGLNAGHVIAGGPQVLLGNFLNSRSPASVLPPILRYLAGDTSADAVAWSNGVLFEQIAASSAPYPHVIIHVGEHEPHYREHVQPLLDWLASRGLPSPSLDLGDYKTHPELDLHFPTFFREKVMTIVRSA